MSSCFFVYGDDADQGNGKRKARVVTPDFNEALQVFLSVIEYDEHGELVWSS